jgi:hypothetical protein
MKLIFTLIKSTDLLYFEIPNYILVWPGWAWKYSLFLTNGGLETVGNPEP